MTHKIRDLKEKALSFILKLWQWQNNIDNYQIGEALLRVAYLYGCSSVT